MHAYVRRTDLLDFNFQFMQLVAASRTATTCYRVACAIDTYDYYDYDKRIYINLYAIFLDDVFDEGIYIRTNDSGKWKMKKSRA